MICLKCKKKLIFQLGECVFNYIYKFLSNGIYSASLPNKVLVA